MTHIGEAAQIAYAAGVDPIGWAEYEIRELITVHRQLAGLCETTGLEPDGDLSDAAMSRRIVGLLLNAGWAAPPTANDSMEGL